MEKRYVLTAFLAIVFIAPLVSASSITRSFSKGTVYPGEEISVTLDITVTGESYYLIDEMFPQGWVVTDKGSGDTQDPGHVKWAIIQNAASTSYIYKIRAPATEGIYTFSGKYMFEGMTVEANIAGQQTVTVSSSQGLGGYGTTVLIAVIVVAALVLSLVLFKSKRGKA